MNTCPVLSLQVVCLREAERSLRWRCEELELQTGEQELSLKEMEAAMQRLALDTDRRLTQQHREHQSNTQLLLSKIKGVSTPLLCDAVRDWGLDSPEEALQLQESPSLSDWRGLCH